MGLCTPHISGIVRAPEAIAVYSSVLETTSAKSGTTFQWQRLPTDPIGSFALTLTNLVIGSSIRIETQAGALIEFRTAASAAESFTAPAYAAGNPSNNLRIKVRKGTSAPKYQPFETQAVAVVGLQSVYIAQVADLIA